MAILRRPTPSVAAKTGAAIALCLPLLMQSEGNRLTTYLDPVGIPTVCAGLTGPDIKLGQKFTPEQCAMMTRARLDKEAAAIAKCLPPTLPTPMFAAFLDLSHNIGMAGFCKSQSAAKARAGDLKGACAAVMGWCKECSLLPGILTRRKAERALCEKGLTR